MNNNVYTLVVFAMFLFFGAFLCTFTAVSPDQSFTYIATFSSIGFLCLLGCITVVIFAIKTRTVDKKK